MKAQDRVVRTSDDRPGTLVHQVGSYAWKVRFDDGVEVLAGEQDLVLEKTDAAPDAADTQDEPPAETPPADAPPEEPPPADTPEEPPAG